VQIKKYVLLIIGLLCCSIDISTTYDPIVKLDIAQWDQVPREELIELIMTKCAMKDVRSKHFVFHRGNDDHVSMKILKQMKLDERERKAVLSGLKQVDIQIDSATLVRVCYYRADNWFDGDRDNERTFVCMRH